MAHFMEVIAFFEKWKGISWKRKKRKYRQNMSYYVRGLVWFGLVSLFNGNLRGLFNAKAILVEVQQWYYLIQRWGDKGVQYLSQSY